MHSVSEVAASVGEQIDDDAGRRSFFQTMTQDDESCNTMTLVIVALFGQGGISMHERKEATTAQDDPDLSHGQHDRCTSEATVMSLQCGSEAERAVVHVDLTFSHDARRCRNTTDAPLKRRKTTHFGQ